MMSLWNKGALVMGIKGAYAHGQLKNDYSHHMGTLFTLRLPVKLPAVNFDKYLMGSTALL